MKMNKIALSALCVFLFIENIYAQFKEIKSPFNSTIKVVLQDSQKMIWAASSKSLAYYDGYEFNGVSLNIQGATGSVKINDIQPNSNSELLIATESHGLLVYKIDQSEKIKAAEKITDKTIYKIEHSPEGLWIATNQRLYLLDGKSHTFYTYPHDQLFVNEIAYQKGQVLIASENRLISFNTAEKTFSDIHYPKSSQTKHLFDMHVNQANDLFISGDQGIYKRDTLTQEWLLSDQNPTYCIGRVLDSDKNALWVGTVTQGLASNPSNNHSAGKHFLAENSNISNNHVTALYKDHDENMWLGYVDGSLSMSTHNSTAINFNASGFSGCQDINSAVSSFIEDKDNKIWVVSDQGLIMIDPVKQSCQTIEVELGARPYLGSTSIPELIFKDNANKLWVYYHSLGLVQLGNTVNNISEIDLPINREKAVLYRFITQQTATTFVFAAQNGMVIYDMENKSLQAVSVDSEALKSAFVWDSIKLSSDEYLLATNQGIATYNNKVLQHETILQAVLPTKKTRSIFKDSDNNIWVGTIDLGVFKFNEKKELINHFHDQPQFVNKTNIGTIIEDDKKNIWLTSDSHLMRINHPNDQVDVFDVSDGMQAKIFSEDSSIKLSNGQLYFGATNGFVSFHPEQLKIDQTPPPVVLTNLTRFNETIEPRIDYQGFQINESINTLQKLVLDHNDDVIGFEFAALDYAAPQNSQYAYKLEGLDPNWHYVGAQNRVATYTKLPSGYYQFKVKASNKNGVWNEVGHTIDVVVKPAPWLSGWALLCYVATLILAIAAYINKKTQDSKSQAALLKAEVENKTQELRLQKHKVESLLMKKNELFSHVSHEFRTPLTLILGPLKELINQNLKTQSIHSLQIMNRNANRLLSLVEQLLQLSKISEDEKIIKSTQQTATQIQSVVDSFQHHAQNKQLKLLLLQNPDAYIHVTDQFVDAVLGNLLSNAIKYTEADGQIEISATVNQQVFVLKVKDTGIGFSEQQQQEVFKMFKRLHTHLDIDGIGIGLSVVQEVVKVNQGQITVISEVGVGSEFTVKLPLSVSSVSTDDQHSHTLLTQLTNELTRSESEIKVVPLTHDDGRNHILVIEDNQDMLDYIVQCTQPHYNSMIAARGKTGVALAIEYIPDLIICDVMMPEMDGFKVSRIIRSDERTSHIPVILLTALNDKVSRIRGWREHVDAYMTKPFDRDELLLQIENMLTIRDILKKKTSQSMVSGKLKPLSGQVDLAKKDQQFINKLMQLIERYYPEPKLNLAFMASEMAYSDRQLQRKIKALINQNPMDVLREFRLKKASSLLKEGNPVSVIADQCGFSSVSYFSSCFKAQYGMSPKQYRQSVVLKNSN